MLTAEKLAYVAGIIDGEGHISIRRSMPANASKQKRLSPAYEIMVGITNTSPKLIEFLKDEFGGTVTLMNQDRPEHHKPCFRWGLSSNQAIRFIEAIAPFLLVKKERAELVLAYSRIKPEYDRTNEGYRIVSEETIKAKDEIYHRIRSLVDYRGPNGSKEVS